MTIAKQIVPRRIFIMTFELGNGEHTATLNILSEDEEVFQLCTTISAGIPEQAAYDLAKSVIYPWDGCVIDSVKVCDTEGEIVREFSLSFLLETYKMLSQSTKTAKFISEDEDQFDFEFEVDFEEDS